MSVTKNYTGGKVMRFYINWHGKEYIVRSISWFDDGSLMYVTFDDERSEDGVTTIFEHEYNLEKHVYTKENVPAPTETRKEKTI